MIKVAEEINAKEYGRLLSKALPAIIKTEEENGRALLLVVDLMSKGTKMSFEEQSLLELLGKLIADFEEDFYQPQNASPQEVLIELMNARGLKQTDLAVVLGSKSRVSEFLNGKRELSKAQIRSLSQFFGVSADLFI